MWKSNEVEIVHCSYHKCLTVYYAKVMSGLVGGRGAVEQQYKHFNSRLDEFNASKDDYKIASVNNHFLDFKNISSKIKVSRFIRDPRDLVVSGFFYHKRGAEKWCHVQDPVDEDWLVVNGTVPQGVGAGQSFATYLQGLSDEDGMIAEIEFRKKHFESMALWPSDNARLMTIRYEDIIGNEEREFGKLFDFYKLSKKQKLAGFELVNKYAANKQNGKTEHIRNPKTSQWKDYFTPKVTDYFKQVHGGLIENYDYEW